MSILSQFKQSQNTDFPNVRPSLDLRFALAKKLDPRITFTRGSTGTYFGSDGLMRTAGVNEPRFDHDPIKGQSLGLLIEESRVNLLTYSEDFSNGIWTKSKGGVALTPVVTSNAVTSPSGELTADKVVFDISGGTTTTEFSFLAQSYSSVSGTTYTVSAWVRVDSGTSNIFIDCESSNTNIVQVTSTWQRFSVTRTSGSSAGKTVRIGLRGNVATSKSATIYVWGAQLEAGAFPTSYIPTTASTVTRSADNAQMTGTNFSSWYNQTEGSIVTTYQQNSNVTYNFGVFSLTSSNSNNNNLIDYFVGGGSSPVFRITYNGITLQVYEYGGTSSANIKNKGAFSFTTNKFTKCINGTFYSTSLASPITSGIKIPTVNTLVLGPYWGGVQPLNGTISRLTYYPIQLTNQQLINLTS